MLHRIGQRSAVSARRLSGVHVKSIYPTSYTLLHPLSRPQVHFPLSSRFPPISGIQIRHFSNFDDWKRNTSVTDKLKTGVVVVAGVGVFALVSSVAFGVVITGVIGLGAYGLYQSLRQNISSGSSSMNTPRSISSLLNKTRVRGENPLFAGMPLVLRGLMTSMLGMVGGALKTSWNRIAIVRKHVDLKLQQHPSIRAQLGPNVRVGNPEQVMEQTVNGVGHVEALFPLVGGKHRAFVKVNAAIDGENRLKYQKLIYMNQTTGETRDLLVEMGKTTVVLDADFKEL